MAPGLVVVDGIRRTRSTLALWHAQRWSVLGVWFLGSFSIGLTLLLATWVVSRMVTADVSPVEITAVIPDSVGHLLFRNSLVLALHAMACVAGFIAGSSLPLEAERYGPRWRAVHDHAGRFAMLFVAGATLFSLLTQAFVLGSGAATIASQHDVSSALLLVCVLPHAIPELTALFLPLAAWLLASRNDDWDHLMAATLVTVAIAVPMLIASALIEVHVTPHILRAVL